MTVPLLLAGLLVLGEAAPLAAQEAWTTYRNPRFGTRIAYQEYFQPDAPPANGDGQSFTGPEVTSFRVYARRNLGGESPSSILADRLADGDHPNPSYQDIRKNRLTISGRKDQQIYYESYIVSASGVVHAFAIEYPARYKADYDPVVARMAKSFAGP